MRGADQEEGGGGPGDHDYPPPLSLFRDPKLPKEGGGGKLPTCALIKRV